MGKNIVKKSQCKHCGHVQDYNYKYCLECSEEMDDDYVTVDEEEVNAYNEKLETVKKVIKKRKSIVLLRYLGICLIILAPILFLIHDPIIAYMETQDHLRVKGPAIILFIAYIAIILPKEFVLLLYLPLGIILYFLSKYLARKGL